MSERIVHECIQKLLGNPEEDEIESLCRLLATVGKLLDHPRARAHMDIYFARMQEVGKSYKIMPHTQSVLRVSSTVCVRQ